MSNIAAPEKFIVRDLRRQGYFTIDNEIVDYFADRIGAYGLAVYVVLCRHARNGTQEAQLSAREIGTRLDISHDRVRKSLVDLSNTGLIWQEVPDRPGPGLISIYTLADVKQLTLKLTGRHTSSSSNDWTPHVQSEQQLDVIRPRNKEEKNKTENKNFCVTCGGVGLVHQRADKPGPRLIPCTDCSVVEKKDPQKATA